MSFAALAAPPASQPASTTAQRQLIIRFPDNHFPSIDPNTGVPSFNLQNITGAIQNDFAYRAMAKALHLSLPEIYQRANPTYGVPGGPGGFGAPVDPAAAPFGRPGAPGPGVPGAVGDAGEAAPAPLPWIVHALMVPPDDPATTVIQISVSPNPASHENPPVSASALVDSIAELARDHVLSMYKSNLQAVQQSAAAAQDAANKSDSARNQRRGDIERLRADLQSTTGRTDVSVAGIRGTVDSLEQERQKLELDVAGMRARHDALEEALAEQSAKAKAVAASDPVATELQKVVDVRRQQVELLQQQNKSGLSSSADVQTAQVALAEAQARLAERKLNAGGAGLDSMTAWNKELLDLTIDLREKEARLQLLNKKLKDFADAIPRALDLERLSGTLADLDRTAAVESAKARQMADNVKAVSEQAPEVTIKSI